MTSDSSRLASLIDFPSRFTLKIMGYNRPAFRSTVLAITQRHASDTTDADIQQRYSADKNYISLSVTILAQSRVQLDELYRELSGHEWVLMTL